jgi:hypothetical protein
MKPSLALAIAVRKQAYKAKSPSVSMPDSAPQPKEESKSLVANAVKKVRSK